MDESDQAGQKGTLQSEWRATEAPPLHAELPPLRVDNTGTVRVGDSRVTLDVLVSAYEGGMEPEAIVRAYDTLNLADVHGAIAYYLRHREEVQAYLRRREEEAARLRKLIEANQPPRPTREELLARRSQRQHDHAQTGQ
jgi:uncharacterized protein (DUF433 family)